MLGADALDRNFEYDPIYRLTYADGRESDTQNANDYLYDDAPAPGSPNASNVRFYSQTFDYDKLGNVQNVIQGGTNGFTRHFVYNSGVNTLQKVEDATPSLIQAFTYDTCGNQITAGATRNYVWNHSDQLLCYYNQAGVSDPTVFTQYDYSGQDRVSKMVRTVSNFERTIYIDGIFEYVWTDTGYEKNYIRIMDDKSSIAEVRVGDVFPGDIADDVVYMLENQIGSSVMRLDNTGTEIDKEEYYPFGDSSLRTFTYKRYRYVGKERDQESGMYYYGARYYVPWTCKFISVDPLAAQYPFYTPYNYAGNKPINKIDVDGMQENGGSPQQTPNMPSTTTGSGGSTPQGGGGGGNGSLTSGNTGGNGSENTGNILLSSKTDGSVKKEGVDGASTPLKGNTQIKSKPKAPDNLPSKPPPSLPTSNPLSDLMGPPGTPDYSKFDQRPPDKLEAAPRTWGQDFRDGAKRSGEGMIIYGMVNQFYIWYNWTVHRDVHDIAGENVGYSGATSASLFSILSLAGPIFGELNAIKNAINVPVNAPPGRILTTLQEIVIEPVELTTSSIKTNPSRTYTIFDGTDQLYKFGVTDEGLFRYNQSLTEAGPNARGYYSDVMPKYKAHIAEKYLRSLHYNSTGQYALPGMRKPYPINFNTGKRIKP